MKIIAYILSISIVLGFSTICNATLIDRGGGMIYDDVLNVTWLQNTNIAGHGMTWDAAMNWVDNFSYQGYDDWRLPTSPATRQGFINEGELGHLYYTTLENPAYGPLTNTGPFENLPSTAVFWLSSTPLYPGSAWNFEFYRGMQNASSSDFNNWYVWAVRDGDVRCQPAPVPEPSTMFLLCAGLVGLVGYRRFRK